MDKELVAPCGMNCGICSGYLAKKYDIRSKGVRMTYCAGCRPRNKQCAFLKKRCETLLNGRVEYCYECESYPCERLRHIDKRYFLSQFRMSMIENLEYIKEYGMEKFLKKEEANWRCPECGGTICCHNGICFNCGLEKLKKKKNKYRWEDE
jgi:hypothetical protein